MICRKSSFLFLPASTTTRAIMLSLSSPVSILAIPAMWLVSYYPGFLKVCKIFKLDFVAYSFELSHEGVNPEKSWWI